jgi:hypothetical protein
MFFYRFLAALCALCLISACGNNFTANELSSLRPEGAVEDARNAVTAGDTRLLAVNGAALEVPGVDDTPENLRAKYGIRVLEGTSDTPTPDEVELNDRARQYAMAYNREIVELSRQDKRGVVTRAS